MTVETILVLIGIYLLASVVQGFTGFAFGLLSVPLLSLLYGPQNAVGMVAVVATIQSAYNFTLLRKGVEYRRLVPLAAVAMLFVPIGAYFLHHLSSSLLMATLGAVIIGLTAFSMAFGNRSRRVLAVRPVGYGFAMLSGLLGGAFSSPGPPMITYLYAGDESRIRARSNVLFFFALVSTTILVAHIIAGTIDRFVLPRSLPFVPVMFLGTKLGVVASGKVPARAFTVFTDAALIALGGYLIISNVSGGA